MYCNIDVNTQILSGCCLNLLEILPGYLFTLLFIVVGVFLLLKGPGIIDGIIDRFFGNKCPKCKGLMNFNEINARCYCVKCGWPAGQFKKKSKHL